MADALRATPYAQRHFREIVGYAREHNPFYERWIADPENVPILDRTTVLDHNDEILAGFPVTERTSGSTGVPVRVSHSEQWARIAGQDVVRFVRQLGGRLPSVKFLYFPDGTDSDGLDVGAPIEAQIDFILRRRAEAGTRAITTYPTNAEMLSQAVLDRAIDMSFITRFGMYGEAIEPFHTAAVRRAFPNARVWTTYSSVEFGIIAAICPYEPGFHHISAHRLGVEVLRDDGSPSEAGELGRVVVTDYFNRQSPLIRYEIGDYAERGRCPCGRIRLPAFKRIHGKTRGALLHRNGNRVLFAGLSVALRDIPGVRQYQVLQDGLENFTVKIVAGRNLDTEVRAAFHAHFGYVPEQLRTEYVGTIPRGPNGKFYASICRV